jgi:23S rRNA (guanosine2251-2'-O)-methyltransferase
VTAPNKKSGAWIYGVNTVTEALRHGRKIDALYVGQWIKGERLGALVEMAARRQVPVKTVGKDFFDRFGGAVHQGVCASAEAAVARSLQDVFDEAMGLFDEAAGRGAPPLFLILDGVEDPGNMGAILRVCDAAGVSGVVFQSHRSAGIGPAVEKTSAGAAWFVPLCEVPNIKHAMRFFSQHGLSVIGAENGAEKTPWETDLKIPLALVLGSEEHGLRRTVREQCDMLAGLPHLGKVGSLNVSVAAGIFLFECLRQRRYT